MFVFLIKFLVFSCLQQVDKRTISGILDSKNNIKFTILDSNNGILYCITIKLYIIVRI